MSSLVLELRADEVMIVNGAPIRFRTRSRVELYCSQALRRSAVISDCSAAMRAAAWRASWRALSVSPWFLLKIGIGALKKAPHSLPVSEPGASCR